MPTTAPRTQEYNLREAVTRRTRSSRMRSLLAICLLLISTPAIGRAQRKSVGNEPAAAGSSETRLSRAPLTRAQRKEAERQLSDLGYWTGAVDGILDQTTRSALIAFQKW